MTLLTMVQNVANETLLSEAPTTIIGNADKFGKLLKLKIRAQIIMNKILVTLSCPKIGLHKNRQKRLRL